MNLTEFKAWFEGYTEEMDGAPSKKQWEKIKGKVCDITPNPTPAPVFIEKYREYFPYWKYYGGTWTSNQLYCNQAVPPADFSGMASTINCSSMPAFNGFVSSTVVKDCPEGTTFSPTDMYREIGRMEAKGVIQ